MIHEVKNRVDKLYQNSTRSNPLTEMMIRSEESERKSGYQEEA